MRDYRDAKAMAQSLRDSLAAKNLIVSHSESLELVSRMLGLANWNRLSATIQTRPNTAAVSSNIADSLSDTTDERRRKLREQAAPRTAVPFASQLFDKFVGYYQLEPGTLLRLYREGERYFSQITGQALVEIYPESEMKFFTTVVDAQISFISNDHGQVTDLILHQDGFERRLKRIDGESAERQVGRLAERINNNRPDPRSEKALRQFVEGIISGDPNYDEMGFDQAQSIRDQLTGLQAFIREKGQIRSIRFVGVQENGDDTYHVEHEGRLFRWTIGLGMDGKVERSWVISGG